MRLADFLKKQGRMLPEKKEYQGTRQEIEEQIDYNKIIDGIANLEVDEPLEIDEGKIWNILANVKGCKPNKEDCSFSRCNNWGECVNLAKAIKQALQKD